MRRRVGVCTRSCSSDSDDHDDFRTNQKTWRAHTHTLLFGIETSAEGPCPPPPPGLLYVTEGSGCPNRLISWLDDMHDPAENSSMLEFVRMLALFILGLPACLFIAACGLKRPAPVGPHYCCCAPLHLVHYRLTLLIWCDRTLAKGVCSGFECSQV